MRRCPTPPGRAATGSTRSTCSFAGSLRLFALTPSLGSSESLVIAPQMMRGRDMPPEQLQVAAITEATVRLSVGLEDVEDLTRDVLRALDKA